MMVEGQPPADTLVDPLYVFAVNTLLADATLAGLLRRLEETSLMWETEASYQDACIAVCDFRGGVCHQQRSISQKGLLIVMDQRLFFLKSHVLYGAVHTAGQFYMVPARYVDDLLRDGIAETEAQHEDACARKRTAWRRSTQPMTTTTPSSKWRPKRSRIPNRFLCASVVNRFLMFADVCKVRSQ
jgi:hypothetical protein